MGTIAIIMATVKFVGYQEKNGTIKTSASSTESR